MADICKGRVRVQNLCLIHVAGSRLHLFWFCWGIEKELGVHCIHLINTHNNASIILILHKSVVKPHKFLMLTYGCEISFLESLESGLQITKQSPCYLQLHLATTQDCLTLVWTVNLTFSCSLRASEMSTIKLVSVARSTLAVRTCKNMQRRGKIRAEHHFKK